MGCVTPYAIFITLAQLMQMLVGMYVTIKAVFHQTRGEECHVNKTNSVLGLVMYFSYSCSSSSCSWTIIAANLKTPQACRASHLLPWILRAKLPKKRLTICVQMWTRTRQRRKHSKLAQPRGALVFLCSSVLTCFF